MPGVGRGYADDALWRAQLSPYASLRSLDDDERARLLDAVRGVIAAGSSSSAGAPAGCRSRSSASTSRCTRAYGTPCPRCGDTLRRVSYESHEVAYCPTCQTDGKVLADRRMSRLVK